MHHFRGKLLQGVETCLDPANVYIQYHTTASDHGQGWYGYLVVASETDVEPGATYTLALADGRSGQLRIDAVSSDASGEVRATFLGEGSLG
ncbi:MAG: hypothetical protein P4L84_32495 [Isosphaeraceae bacterium]|nr:hypothetical protein [Isosphaeraceae bacterium]